MKQLLILSLLCLTAMVARGADDSDTMLMSRQENFERFTQMFPQERVYVHFDNTSYYKGEHIWYKAYVVSDDHFRPTDLSRILYVELLNPIGYPVETQKLVIEHGQAHGSFLLKDTLNSGFYEVRAYTQWMLNFTTGDPHGWRRMHSKEAKRQWGDRALRYMEGNAGVFSRVFPVYERVDSGRYYMRRMLRLPKATASMTTPVKDKLQLTFYPEGGNLIRDVQGRIAFQARTAEGRTLNVAGALVRRGDSIGSFKTDYAGRGVLAVTPDSLDAEELTDGLKLRLTYQGRDYQFSLPKPQKRGYALSVLSMGEQLKAIIARNTKTRGLRLGLSVTSRGHTFYCSTVDLRSDLQAVALIDKHSLQTGVNVVTLFTAKGKVLAQRLVFVNNHDMEGLHIMITENSQLSTLNSQFYKGVSLDCQLIDAAGQPVKGVHDFSIAVTDRESREETYDDNTILSYLLLSSEVKGFIPHPGYFFEADDAEHRQALDQLLMVQGWTRYDYEQMMSDETFEPMLAVERGLTFAGRVWDDDDYEQHAFWKVQANKPYWVYSELYIDGDTVETDHSLDDFLYPATMFHEGGRAPQIILTGEDHIDSMGVFRLNMRPFYGKGRIALMLNKKSIEELGLNKGGVGGHNFRWNTIRRPAYLLGKRIEPLNQYSPLPKDYDYYETAALQDPIERDMFRYGFMAMPKEGRGRLTYYDQESGSYVLPGVQKLKKRHWSDFREVSPVSVMDVKELMAWLSNIFGDIQDFKYRQPSPYGSDGGPVATHTNFITRMVLEDASWLDSEQGREQHAAQLGQVADRIAQLRTPVGHHVDEQPIFANLSEMLYIFGLDGQNIRYVNAGTTGGQPHYTTAVGTDSLLPPGLRFFPINENFKEVRLYADCDNRVLTHRRGRYHEALEEYDVVRPYKLDAPLTSILNFVTDDSYDNSHPLPDFLGFRINFQGLTRPAEFYCPDYDWEPEPEETDYRRTVYWNPQVHTDADGRAHIEFFNNGFSKQLTVSAEGITAEGQPIHAK